MPQLVHTDDVRRVVVKAHQRILDAIDRLDAVLAEIAEDAHEVRPEFGARLLVALPVHQRIIADRHVHTLSIPPGTVPGRS